MTVADTIRMARLADEAYFKGDSSKDRVAHFSPDGKQFVVILRKGNLEQNTNEYSLLLYESKDAVRSPKPNPLLTMSSSSNRDAIKSVNWLADSETVVFLGENAGQSPQVYAFNLKTERLSQYTNHVTPIVNYAISADGQRVLFAAEPAPKKTVATETSRKAGIVITTQSLDSILAGDCYSYRPNFVEGEELFLKVGQAPEKRIPVQDVILDHDFLSLSPNGRYGVFEVLVRDIPKDWKEYEDQWVRELAIEQRLNGVASDLRRYMLLDTEDKSVRPLLNVPNVGNPPRWRPDSLAVFMPKTLLPLNASDPAERDARKKNTYDAQVNLISGEVGKVSDEDLPEGHAGSKTLEVMLEEGINTPPEIYVTNLKTKQKSLLLDLNPQFADLDFGRVESVSWKATDGHEVVGGLYFPRHFDPQKKYSLVIQTHGFDPRKFWIDGPWSSAFAAQPLASAGFVVLQVGAAKDGDDAKYVNSEMEGPRAMAAYEGAIDYLDARHMIDRDRVGITGFSRTVFTVGYTLTHSRYKFSAAMLVDGVDGGYFQYLAFSTTEEEHMNGGLPWGKDLAAWAKNSPGFNLDKVNAPLRLVALQGSILGMWEWFAGLSRLEKPVDFIDLPEAQHLIVKPWERIVAQQGLVDWFRFWLKSEEDPDPAKQEQYQRWRALRRLQDSSSP